MTEPKTWTGDDIETAMELARDANGDSIEQRVVACLRDEVLRLRADRDVVHIKSGMYYESQWGPMTEELKRYREREPLVRAVFTAIVGNADSYYNTEFAPAAIEAMRQSLKASASAAEDKP